MEALKQKILFNLECLKEKVNFQQSTPQVIRLNSYFFDEDTQTRYNLTVEVVVSMAPGENGLEISDHYIEDLFFFRNEGDTPKFRFSRAELEDYIDY